MGKNIVTFPLTVDLQSANWRLYGAQANNAITVHNNQIIAGLAIDRIDMFDHVYDFSHVLSQDREKNQ